MLSWLYALNNINGYNNKLFHQDEQYERIYNFSFTLYIMQLGYTLLLQSKRWKMKINLYYNICTIYYKCITYMCMYICIHLLFVYEW